MRGLATAALASCLLFSSSVCARAAQGQPASAERVRASLVTGVDVVRPGAEMDAGLWMEIEPGWHVYWTNPGEAGLPTHVRWDLPEGWEASEPEWPMPSRFESGGVIGYGYAGNLLVPVRIRVSASAPAGPAELAAEISWLACESVCVPGAATLAVSVEVSAEPPASPVSGAWQSRLAAARSRVPVPLPSDWAVAATARADRTLSLMVRPPKEAAASRPADFFPYDAESVELSTPAITQTDGGYTLTLGLSVLAERAPERLSGVLVPEGAGRPAWILDVPVVVGDGPEAL